MNMQEAKQQLETDYGNVMAVMTHETGNAGIYPSGHTAEVDGIKRNWYYEWVTHYSRLWHPKEDMTRLAIGGFLGSHLQYECGEKREHPSHYDSWVIQDFYAEALCEWGIQTEKEKVYFVSGGGLIKIGMSIDVKGRLKYLRAHSPVPLELLAVARGGRRYESWLHSEFHCNRDHNEWFTPSESLWALIKKHQKLS